MTFTTPFMTLEEYFAYDDGTDTRYELVDGVLVPMPAENPYNLLIATFLLVYFAQLGIPLNRLGIKHQIAVSSNQATAREPDLVVHSEASAIALFQERQSLLRGDMPAPLLVIEIVSPGEPGSANYDRDYLEKRREYAERGIPEYWLIDAERKWVMVLSLSGNSYQANTFTGDAVVLSALFPEFALTANQILAVGQ